MKAPSLISDEAKKKSDADLATAITGTAKHPGPVKALAADDVKASLPTFAACRSSDWFGYGCSLRCALLSDRGAANWKAFK
jgi:hypothetical protein